MLKFVPQNIRKENILIDFLFLAIHNPTENNRRRLHIGNIYFLLTFPPIAPDSSFSHYLQTPFRPPDIHWTLHMLIFSSTFMFSFTFWLQSKFKRVGAWVSDMFF